MVNRVVIAKWLWLVVDYDAINFHLKIYLGVHKYSTHEEYDFLYTKRWEANVAFRK